MSRRRRRVPWRLLVVIGLVCVALGVGAVATNAAGMRDRFERLVIKVEDFFAGPVPDRTTKPTITLTPPPSGTPVSTAEPSPGESSGPPATATPAPVREAVDIKIIDKPEAVFAHEVRDDWCAPAGVQMVLAAHGVGNTSDDFQREIAGRVREWESRADSLNGRWGPASMVLALEAYGVPGYEIHAWTTRGDAVRDAAVHMARTGAPAILLAWKGAHTWIMTGYTADADPLVFPDAVMTGIYVNDPWYPWISSIWGPSDPPGTIQDDAEMRRNFLPWERPEGRYPDRDGKWIIIVPTVALPGWVAGTS
jgi:hypothetical protein